MASLAGMRGSSGMITCRDCETALHPYIDRELTESEIGQVRLHLDACRGCLHLYQFEASIRRLVRVRCREQGAPAELRERVVQALRDAQSRERKPSAD